MRTAKRILTVVLTVYWLAMFVATHIPQVPQDLPMPGGDKGMHFAAYAILALIVSMRCKLGAAWCWKAAAQIFAVIAIYGIFDELTQIPVGRHADVLDWLADIAGTVCGLLLAALGGWLVYSRAESLRRRFLGTRECARDDA
jgi:VanZ family protein